MDEHPLEIYDGHSLARVDGRLLLVDTGSPKSFGVGALTLSGQVFPLAADLRGITSATVSAQLGRSVDGLLGADVLSSFVVIFDWHRQVIAFADEAPAWPGSAPMSLVSGLVATRFSLAGRELGAFLDSGAKISYLDPDFLGSGRPAGRARDFHPSCLAFETAIEDAEIAWGGLRFPVRFGRLPKSLQAMVDAGGLRSVLGSDLFRRFAITIDYPGRGLRLRPFESVVTGEFGDRA